MSRRQSAYEYALREQEGRVAWVSNVSAEISLGKGGVDEGD